MSSRCVIVLSSRVKSSRCVASLRESARCDFRELTDWVLKNQDRDFLPIHFYLFFWKSLQSTVTFVSCSFIVHWGGYCSVSFFWVPQCQKYFCPAGLSKYCDLAFVLCLLCSLLCTVLLHVLCSVLLSSPHSLNIPSTAHCCSQIYFLDLEGFREAPLRGSHSLWILPQGDNTLNNWHPWIAN